MKKMTSNNGKSSSQTRAKNKFNHARYDRLYSFVKAGEKEKIHAAAEKSGQSLNDYVVTAIYEKMERDKNK